MAPYRIFALKYAGPLVGPAMMLMWMRDLDRTAERAYYIWCIRGGGHDTGGTADMSRTVVVDAGISPQKAAERDLAGYVSPVEMLSRLDVDASAVRHVVLTHLHWDHVNGARLFPRATFYVQEREYRFWRDHPLAGRPPLRHVSDPQTYRFLGSLEGSSRLVLHDGDAELMPGIRCLLSPGHTLGLQTVAVETERGTAVVGSDCAHVFGNYREDWPSSVIMNMLDWLETYDRIRSVASSPDLLFPGHDPVMTSGYPTVAEDVTRLA